MSTEAVVDPLDSRYFSFFLTSVPEMLVYSNLFPSLVGDIFCGGVQHTCVSRSILSTASMIADHRLQRPMDRCKVQYITTIQLIQSAIREERVDESLAIAVFLIAWGDAISSRF
jgi:hypothetical protein